MTEQQALLSLHMIPNIGGGTIRNLITHFGSAKKVLSRSVPQLERVEGIGRITANLISKGVSNLDVEYQLELANKKGIKILPFRDSHYPKRLLNAFDAPTLLYSKGEVNLNPSRVLAIVGTRKATRYGLDFTRRLLNDLKEYDPLIISGLAYGIDIVAHTSSLDLELATVAVVASGVDIIYPAMHKSTAQRIQSRGAILSEYPIGELPIPNKFPARNRIIAGLSDAVIVIEAAEKGGALITANFANDYNREVFALPGDVDRPYSRGTNRLIRDHKARIVTGAEDIVYALNWEKENTTAKSQLSLYDMEGDELSVYDILQKETDPAIDAIAWATRIPLNKLASVLLNMEFKGYIQSLPGSKYRLTQMGRG